MLPGGEAVLFTGHAITLRYDEANIEVLSLMSGGTRIVLRGGSYGRYVSSGHLLYVNQSTLYAAPFDLKRLEVRGSPVALVDDVSQRTDNGAGRFDAANGTQAFHVDAEAIRSKPSNRRESNTHLDRSRMRPKVEDQTKNKPSSICQPISGERRRRRAMPEEED
jgi:hypothetical protein